MAAEALRRFRCQSLCVCPIGLSVGMRGITPRAGCACEAPAPRLSFSCVKKKDGGERKSLANRRAGKEHVESRKPYQLEIAIAPKGAIVRNSAYLPGSVSFSRATGALTRVSILERSPQLYNSVWSPRLKTASPINQNKIIPRLRLPSTDPRMGSAV